MAKCYFCGKEVALPYKCKFCGHYFCVEHHLPENHNCQALIAYKMQRHKKITYMPSPTRSTFIKSEEKVLKSHKVPVRSRSSFYEKYHFWKSIALLSIFLNVAIIVVLIGSLFYTGTIVLKDSRLEWSFQYYIDERLIKQYVLEYINSYRLNNSLNALSEDNFLSNRAQQWAEYLLIHNKFEHSNPPVGMVWGENIAKLWFTVYMGKINEKYMFERQIAYELFDAWRNSPGHNKNMLYKAWNYIGIGLALKKEDYSPGSTDIDIICVTQFRK